MTHDLEEAGTPERMIIIDTLLVIPHADLFF